MQSSTLTPQEKFTNHNPLTQEIITYFLKTFIHESVFVASYLDHCTPEQYQLLLTQVNRTKQALQNILKLSDEPSLINLWDQITPKEKMAHLKSACTNLELTKKNALSQKRNISSISSIDPNLLNEFNDENLSPEDKDSMLLEDIYRYCIPALFNISVDLPIESEISSILSRMSVQQTERIRELAHKLLTHLKNSPSITQNIKEGKHLNLYSYLSSLDQTQFVALIKVNLNKEDLELTKKNVLSQKRNISSISNIDPNLLNEFNDENLSPEDKDSMLLEDIYRYCIPALFNIPVDQKIEGKISNILSRLSLKRTEQIRQVAHQLLVHLKNSPSIAQNIKEGKHLNLYSYLSDLHQTQFVALIKAILTGAKKNSCNIPPAKSAAKKPKHSFWEKPITETFKNNNKPHTKQLISKSLFQDPLSDTRMIKSLQIALQACSHFIEADKIIHSYKSKFPHYEIKIMIFKDAEIRQSLINTITTTQDFDYFNLHYHSLACLIPFKEISDLINRLFSAKTWDYYQHLTTWLAHYEGGKEILNNIGHEIMQQQLIPNGKSGSEFLNRWQENFKGSDSQRYQDIVLKMTEQVSKNSMRLSM